MGIVESVKYCLLIMLKKIFILVVLTAVLKRFKGFIQNLNYIWNNINVLSEVPKNTESKSPRLLKTKNARIMVPSNCVVCDSNKMKFIKEQEVKGY